MQSLDASSWDRISDQLPSGLNIIQLTLNTIQGHQIRSGGKVLRGIEQFASIRTGNHANTWILLQLTRIISIESFVALSYIRYAQPRRAIRMPTRDRTLPAGIDKPQLG